MKNANNIIFTIWSLVIIDGFRLINSTEGVINFPYATYISSLLIYISIVIYIRIAHNDGFENFSVPNSIQNLFKLWLFWNLFNLVRGAFIAVDYWEWKDLLFAGVSFSFIPLVFFLGKNVIIAQTIFKFVIKYLFLYGFILIPLSLITTEELYSRLMTPITLFILFIPFLKYRWKILVLIVATISILMVLGYRSNIIKITFSVLLIITYYLRNFIGKNMLKLAHVSLFAIPIILFSMALSGRYNIFEESAKIEGYEWHNSEGDDESLMADTRTFLYVEVFSSFNKAKDWIIGKSAVSSYQSNWFIDEGGAMNGKRTSTEVGILNIFMRYGIIGILIYFLILYTVSRYAIIYSSNYLAKMIGLFIAFRWTYSFVEEYTIFDLNFYFFWIAIGLVSSVRFRNMKEEDIRDYFGSL